MTDNNLWSGGVIALCVWDLMFMRCRFPLLRTRTLPGHALCHFMTASLLSSHSCVGVQSLQFFVDSASLMFYCFSCWVMIFGNEFIMMMLQGGSRSYHSQISFFILGKSCKYESFDKIQQVHCIGICEMTISFVLTLGKRITSNFLQGRGVTKCMLHFSRE